MFKPPFTLKNRHLQTLYAPLFRKQNTPTVEIERFNLLDGDFVEAYWYKSKPIDTRPIVTLFHGLAGSFASPYIQGVMKALDRKGFASVLMHFRGCSGKANLIPRSYHSGDTADAKAWIEYLSMNYKNSKLHAVGYSIGGNMLLKLLGEEKGKTPLLSAVSVSAPMDLDITAKRINQGFSKRYQKHLLDPLKETLLEKYKTFDMEKILNKSIDDVKNIKTIEEFDELYTAPINGFGTAKNYYKECSAKQFLKHIQIPTLIIHALDDPFMTPEILPTKEELSEYITMSISEHGGHVGFVNGTLLKPNYWLEEHIVKYLLKQSS
ncbi:MAG: hydrolase [Sulfurovum sp.]|nr:MAG: hydrolase [Sulfurovum sp.]